MNKALLQQALDAFLDSRDFYKLMQAYRHTPGDAAKEFEAAKFALRAAIAQPEQSAAPVAPAVPEGDKLDAARLDWLQSQTEAYGFEGTHEGNRWTAGGPFMFVREAIDEAMQATGATP